ncbi:hypothetical protein PQG02_34970 (plasmid) [Nostoc sp. UHCC 0926]|uniref:hypothetical protein n=1 Tax=Nostoc sp. UHCC 0926 TaxID=3025190 RepID=UPI002360CBF2|nr:hypothetical protein [Nostoc sp. UHCC 0926]WDD37017.1 hypothetical protein PQG02_34970 [Nostoc sp. UHCC 0926]
MFDWWKVANYAGFDETTRQQFARIQTERSTNSSSGLTEGSLPSLIWRMNQLIASMAN